jgi:UDP-3-O-[3-hydroxymyristoyl] glucosamine N-acyltransferase
MIKKRADEIAELVGGELSGDGAVEVSDIKDIKEAGPGDLAFILNPKFASMMEGSRAACIVVPPEVRSSGVTIIKTKNPSLAFCKIVDNLMPGRIPHPKGIHPTAVVGERVSLGKNVGLGPYVVIQDDAVIGDNTVIYPFTYVGNRSKIGRDSIIYSNVSIREDIKIGSRVIIHAGTVVGSDGFGFDSSTGMHVKIPQIGDVIIEDDCEIGACVTIDRAKFSHTKIGRGSKIDNLVQIAHNVEMGQGCIVVAQCGISGSTVLGNGVVMGGQVGLVDHIKLGDRVMVGAQAGVTKSFPPNTIIVGSPAKPIMETKRIVAVTDMLPDLYKRIIKIEKHLDLHNK